jgi:hypothetical protein
MLIFKSNPTYTPPKFPTPKTTQPETKKVKMTPDPRANILLIGCAGAGAIAALNLEAGGLAQVTAILRSNYQAVTANGFYINSCDYSILKRLETHEQ